MNKKALKFGSLSVGVTAVVIAIVVVFNLFISELPSKWIKIDTSSNGLVSFSDATKNYLAGVDEEVEIYLVAQTGYEDALVQQLLEYYESERPNITVKNIDPVKNPTFVSEYTDDDISDNSIVVKSDKRHTVVDGSDFYQYELVGYEGYYMSYDEFEYYYSYYLNYYGQVITANEYFNGESLITSAIDYVVTDTLPVFYSATGHGETALGSYYAMALDSLNVTSESVNLVAGEEVAVPEDAAIIFINNPVVDISASELEALKAYVDNGGIIILTTNYEIYTAEDMPNLAALTAYMGLQAVEGLVSESDVSMYTGDSYTIIPNIGTSGYMAPYSGANITFISMYCHGIEATGEGSVTTAPIFTTGSAAHLKDSEEENTFNLAMQSVNTNGGAIFWFASPYMFDDLLLNSCYNDYVFAELVAASCSISAPVDVALKSVNQGTTLTVTEADEVMWSAVYLVIVPVAALVIGFAVWFSRRRK